MHAYLQLHGRDPHVIILSLVCVFLRDLVHSIEEDVDLKLFLFRFSFVDLNEWKNVNYTRQNKSGRRHVGQTP